MRQSRLLPERLTPLPFLAWTATIFLLVSCSTWTVTSVPEGAAVLADGRRVGATPCKVSSEASSIEVRFDARRFANRIATVGLDGRFKIDSTLVLDADGKAKATWDLRERESSSEPAR